MEAAGLLDGWVTPDGRLVDGPWLDSQMVPRAPVAGPSLSDWLRVDGGSAPPVPPAVVERLLAAVACCEEDPADAEAWIAPDGRYRLGSLHGTWHKAQAVHVGHAAREAARARRLEEVAHRLGELVVEAVGLEEERAALADARREADDEWRSYPSDRALHQAHLTATAEARAFRESEQAAERARDAFRIAEEAAGKARETLEWDAGDLGLPTTADSLGDVETALHAFTSAFYRLVQSIGDWRHAQADLVLQQQRENAARQAWEEATEVLSHARLAAEEAQAAAETLRATVGARVEELEEQLRAAEAAVRTAESAEKAQADAMRKSGEARAVAATIAETTQEAMDRAIEERLAAVAGFQRFVGSGLLASALPDLDLPAQALPWTIDPALTLARLVEQKLETEADDDQRWTRVQQALSTDLQDLQRALGALGHHAAAEPSDWGMVVHVVYQNRPERPDALALRLAEEIAQRSELLTAREREVLENHLQADIATEVQRLLLAADRQVKEINVELEKRPTSTGIRYRLQWQPLTEEEGAPAGLTAARQKLLNTNPELWTQEDRQVIGHMLQQRIAAERERADAGQSASSGEGGALADLLARALDYRRWHRFRVERFQDRSWRKLSGPASSGERALGLTVPLFAALASFYGRGASPHAPRLILLDEAFAGIDDASRAHCMALIREFDLDFVITSEREWACYAELPGVAICQLQRREGIDAVHVSRWTWDGRARRREPDPDRRFQPT